MDNSHYTFIKAPSPEIRSNRSRKSTDTGRLRRSIPHFRSMVTATSSTTSAKACMRMRLSSFASVTLSHSPQRCSDIPELHGCVGTATCGRRTSLPQPPWLGSGVSLCPLPSFPGVFPTPRSGGKTSRGYGGKLVRRKSAKFPPSFLIILPPSQATPDCSDASGPPAH